MSAETLQRVIDIQEKVSKLEKHIFLHITLNEYQDAAMRFCMPSCENLEYMFMNLVGEVGEFASKIAKAIRSETLVGKSGRIAIDGDYENVLLRKEAGDILWQLAGLCSVMGWNLEDVAAENLAKLKSRKERGVIDGNGDER